MPFFDLGDKPSTFNPKKTESEQIFIVPASKYPDKIVFRYADWRPQFRVARISSKYSQSNLREKGLSEQEVLESVMNATVYLQPYRGEVNRLDRCNLIGILIALIATIALSMGIGMTKHWAYSLIFIVFFFVYSAISIKVTKVKSNRFLRQAHFMLAVFCRAENNRLFLHRNVEMRPGFMAKWIEFNI